MRIMQRKAANKLGIQANSLKPEKRHITHKPSLQNHDGNSKGTGHLKTKKMKKSRSSKPTELQGTLGLLPKGHDTPRQPGKPPPLMSPASPTKTPSPKKPTPSKIPYASPNYMKSTSSSEARKEKSKAKEIPKIGISNSSKLHRTSKGLTKSSSLKKVWTLIKAPSFKHTRTGGNKCSKVVLCENLDVQRATCSSTLKDSKFPPYLMLNPGATEAAGTSAMKVCSYNYCSLNGHHHSPVPPLKCFLSSKRVLKTQRVVKPDILSPQKAKPSKEDVKGDDKKDDFFVEIYGPGGKEENSKNRVDQSEGTILLEDTCLMKAEESSSASLDEFFGESSDMEWEEGQVSAKNLENWSEVSVPGADSNGGMKSNDTVRRNLEEYMIDKLLLLNYQDEIAEWQSFSDAGSMSDNESSSDEKQIQELNKAKEGDGINISTKDEAIICYAESETKPIEEQDDVLYDPCDEITEGRSEVFDPYLNSDETDDDEANEDYETVVDNAEENKGMIIDKEESTENSSETKFNDKEGSKSDEEKNYSRYFELQSDDDCIMETNDSKMEDINKAEAVDGFPNVENETKQINNGSFSRKRADPTEEIPDSRNTIKKSLRQKKEDEGDELREFNPKEPNFLPIEPDPDAGKVDLRHQEMDERRNSEEWMLDYALQRTVSQLAPARKRKVALLVEAFEAVLPIPECETNLRRNSSGFTHARPIQACS